MYIVHLAPYILRYKNQKHIQNEHCQWSAREISLKMHFVYKMCMWNIEHIAHCINIQCLNNSNFNLMQSAGSFECDLDPKILWLCCQPFTVHQYLQWLNYTYFPAIVTVITVAHRLWPLIYWNKLCFYFLFYFETNRFVLSCVEFNMSNMEQQNQPVFCLLFNRFCLMRFSLVSVGKWWT